jgi:hypothetical protein
MHRSLIEAASHYNHNLLLAAFEVTAFLYPYLAVCGLALEEEVVVYFRIAARMPLPGPRCDAIAVSCGAEWGEA